MGYPSSADQRLEELFQGLANYERTRTLSGPFSLDKIRVLLEGIPAEDHDGDHDEDGGAVWVQVGGSKGKGTTVLYLESLARAAGLRTGAFLSPHIEHVTERVRIDGEPVGSERLVEALEGVLACAGGAGIDPSFFEAITAAAVSIFRCEKVDLVALEVGLGGRLDATTAVPVDGTILTKIEREHTDLLGDTVAEIAAEKAWIMREGKPVWAWPDGDVSAQLEVHARETGSLWSPRPRIESLVDAGTSLRGELVDGAAGDDETGERAAFRLEGGSRFELPALALSWACLRRLVPTADLPLDPVPRPLLPGRFEVVQTDRVGAPLVLDGAHTAGSMGEVASELCRRFPQSTVSALFATAHGKLWKDGLSALMPAVDRFFVTSLEGSAWVSPGEVIQWLREQGRSAEEVAGPAEGLAALADTSDVRLVVGSFYLVGAVRTLIQASHD